jgi:tRNA threonylcarbamoyladenosine biosynthesis protein TsaB
VRILAVDTATENCSAALLIDDRLIGREERLERGHAERILSMTDEVLAEAGIALPSLTAIAFGRGPGAFTGVRLAAAVVQGLAFGAGLAVVPVSDLRAVAQRALASHGRFASVLVCNDARMHEVYWGCFEASPAGVAIPLGGERVGKPADVVMPEGLGKPLLGAGSGFAIYPQLRGLLGEQDEADATILPRAHEIARLAVPEVAAGRVLPAEQALPVYLRDEVAHALGERSLN